MRPVSSDPPCPIVLVSVHIYTNNSYQHRSPGIKHASAMAENFYVNGKRTSGNATSV